MTVDTATIGALFTGLSGLIIAVSAVMDRRNRKLRMEIRSFGRRITFLEKQNRALARYTYDQGMLLQANGIRPPKRPHILDEVWSDDDEGDGLGRLYVQSPA